MSDFCTARAWLCNWLSAPHRMRRCWHSWNRADGWLHVHLAYSEGRTILNIQVVYGIVGKKRNNPQLWKVVLWYMSRLGNAAQMICADYNFKMSNEGDMPRQVFTALRRGLLVDIVRARAEARGQQPKPTFRQDRSRDKD